MSESLDPNDENTFTRKVHGAKFSAREEQVLEKLVEKFGSESNVFREALLLLVDKHKDELKIKLEPGMFAPRRAGNRLPKKENPPVTLIAVAGNRV
jgi:hypothetical protein